MTLAFGKVFRCSASDRKNESTACVSRNPGEPEDSALPRGLAGCGRGERHRHGPLPRRCRPRPSGPASPSPLRIARSACCRGPGLRCCTSTNAMWGLAGKDLSRAVIGSSPPAQAPIPTIGNAPAESGGGSGVGTALWRSFAVAAGALAASGFFLATQNLPLVSFWRQPPEVKRWSECTARTGKRGCWLEAPQRCGSRWNGHCFDSTRRSISATSRESKRLSNLFELDRPSYSAFSS